MKKLALVCNFIAFIWCNALLAAIQAEVYYFKDCNLFGTGHIAIKAIEINNDGSKGKEIYISSDLTNCGLTKQEVNGIVWRRNQPGFADIEEEKYFDFEVTALNTSNVIRKELPVALDITFEQFLLDFTVNAADNINHYSVHKSNCAHLVNLALHTIYPYKIGSRQQELFLLPATVFKDASILEGKERQITKYEFASMVLDITFKFILKDLDENCQKGDVLSMTQIIRSEFIKAAESFMIAKNAQQIYDSDIIVKLDILKSKIQKVKMNLSKKSGNYDFFTKKDPRLEALYRFEKSAEQIVEELLRSGTESMATKMY